MTVCRWCGVEIERSPRFDKLVTRPLDDGRPPVPEAWIDQKWLVCDETHRQWHEPLVPTLDEILSSLREIEADLR